MDKRQVTQEDRQTKGVPKVVIIGGGFGGLWAVRTLCKSDVDVIMVDKNNYHTFFPLLYQVASAELEPEDIAYPIRTILRNMRNVRFVMAEVRQIDFVNRVVRCKEISIGYDYLILAVGSVTQFFGVSGAAENSFQLKNLEHSVILRNHILSCFERASIERDEETKQQLLAFTIVGGGPTGVELAGALAELIQGPLKKDFPNIDFQLIRVILIEAANGILLTFPKELREYAIKKLRRMGIVVMVETMVSQVTPHTVHLKDKGVIATNTVVWTAGVSSAVVQQWGLSASRNARVNVNPFLQLPEFSNVYAIGDMSNVSDGSRPLPMVAPVAIQQGTHAAKNILRDLAGKPGLPFVYKDRGSMVTIGRNSAVASLGKRNFTGFLAWIVWLVIHLMQLIGFRNRLMVFINWAIDYFYFDRAVRLILPIRKVVRTEKNPERKPGKYP